MTIREATPDDAAAIARIKIATWRIAYRGHFPQEGLDGMDVERATARWREILTQEDHTALLHDVDGVVDGFVSFGAVRDDNKGEPSSAGEIYAIYVDPPAWGTGVGRALCNEALTIMARRGSRKVMLWVLAANERARRFYECAGFIADGATKTDSVFDTPIEEVRYWRALAGPDRGAGGAAGHVSGASEPIRVTDIDDPRVEVFRNVRDRDLRGRVDLFMAESEMVLRRLVRRPERLHAVLLSPRRHAALRDVLPSGVPVYVAELDVMTQIAGFHIHRGVLAAGVRPAHYELSLDAALGHLRERATWTVLLAEGMTNVDNMGGLFRNAAAFGVDGIVLDPTCCDPLYRKAVRVSMGHVLSIPYAACRAWPDALVRLRSEWEMTLVAAEVTDDAAPLWELPDAPRLGVLLGAEGHGLSAEALAACDHVCQIPMSPVAESINVGSASAVFLYERLRQRR